MGQISWLLQQGIIIEIRTPFTSYYSTDNVLAATVEFGMATQYSRDLSDNVKRGNKTKLENGGLPGRAPLGYINDKANHTVLINTKIAPIVIEMFEAYATGKYNTRTIAEFLFLKGIKTGSGKRYTRAMADHVLRNPFYYGTIRYNGELYAGNHKPLISKLLFDKVQDVLSGKRVIKSTKHFIPIRGYAQCAVCGCAITAELQRGHWYYHCTNGKKVCDQKKNFVRGDAMDEMVAGVLGNLKTDPEMIEISYLAAKEELQFDKTSQIEQKAKLKNQIQENENRLSKLIDHLTDETITKEAYKAKSGILENELRSLKSQLHELGQENTDNLESTFEQTKNALLRAHFAQNQYLDGDDLKKRELLEILLSNITISDKKVQSYQFKTEFQLVSELPKNAVIADWLASLSQNGGQSSPVRTFSIPLF